VVDTAYDDGEKIGLEKGKIEGKLEVALKLKQKGFPIEIIEKITGLSIEEINQLQ
jgi:predicted transposase/invertase (TIGR01784 family)